MSVGNIRLASKQPEHPRCKVCNRYCNMEDIGEYIEASKEISKAKVTPEVKSAALEYLVANYNVLCESKEPTLCVVCTNPSNDIDDKGIRLLATAIIDGAYFDLLHGKGMNKEAADSFINGNSEEARKTRTTWHEIAGITPPDDGEIEHRVKNWKLAHG